MRDSFKGSAQDPYEDGAKKMFSSSSMKQGMGARSFVISKNKIIPKVDPARKIIVKEQKQTSAAASVPNGLTANLKRDMDLMFE